MAVNLNKLRAPDIDMDRWIADRKKLHEGRRREAEAQRRIVPFASALERLVKAEAAGLIRPAVKASLLRMGEAYAANHKLPFDGTMTGLLRLAGHAERVVRDHAAAVAKLGEDQ
jgi:hypothetical protein